MIAERGWSLVTGVVTILLLIVLPARASGPERGNYVPSDLSVKIHPFVEAYRYGNQYYRGEILRVSEDSVEITVGTEKERRVLNLRRANVNLDPSLLSPGRNVIVKRDGSADPPQFLLTGVDRTHRYLLLLGGCLAFCLVVGGWITLRSLGGVILGLSYLLFLALPLIQAGHSILLQVGLFYVLVTLLVLPGSLGLNRKSVSAIFAALTSGLLAGGLLYSLAHTMNLIGLRDETLQVLEYATRYFPETVKPLSLINIIIGGALIGALGVILDVTVDVTSSVAEIARSRPDLSLGEHLKRTLTVSSQLIGTMTNTLLLAYIGTDLFLILTVYLLPTPSWILLNKDFVAVEVLRSLGGALGFLSAAPLAILFYRWVGPGSETPPEPPESLRTER